jgi:hypothetical protein
VSLLRRGAPEKCLANCLFSELLPPFCVVLTAVSTSRDRFLFVGFLFYFSAADFRGKRVCVHRCSSVVENNFSSASQPCFEERKLRRRLRRFQIRPPLRHRFEKLAALAQAADGDVFVFERDVDDAQDGFGAWRFSRRAKANPPRRHNGQSAWHSREKVCVAHKHFQGLVDLRRRGVLGQFQHNDAGIIFRWVIPNVSEVEIAGDQRELLRLSASGYRIVIHAAGKNFANVLDFVTQAAQEWGG